MKELSFLKEWQEGKMREGEAGRKALKGKALSRL
jgi:hypothetical protein